MTFDPVAFAKGVGEQVRAMVAKAVGELSARLATVEERLNTLPVPKDGKDGKSIGAEEIQPLIEEAVKALPAPKDGKDGQSVTVEQVLPALQAQVEAAIKALPVPQDGKSLAVADIAPLLEEMQSRWALEFERRAQDTLQRSLDRMPAPKDGKDGKDGADGFGFDDMTMEHDGEREFTFRFQRGDQVKEFKFSAPLVIDRGFWKDGMSVAKGDGVTFGGSYWVAQKDTKTKPDTTNPDFRLAVKKGRDGKDGDKGERGPQGEKGLPGLNGKNL